jgi:hypothetical protein
MPNDWDRDGRPCSVQERIYINLREDLRAARERLSTYRDGDWKIFERLRAEERVRLLEAKVEEEEARGKHHRRDPAAREMK